MKKEEPEEELEQNTVLLTEIRDLLRENINNINRFINLQSKVDKSIFIETFHFNSI